MSRGVGTKISVSKDVFNNQEIIIISSLILLNFFPKSYNKKSQYISNFIQNTRPVFTAGGRGNLMVLN